MSTEVASTRLPREILRDIDRAASARGVPRSVYLAELIERGAHQGASRDADGQIKALTSALGAVLEEVRESHRILAHVLGEIRASRGTSTESPSSLLERLAFSTFFCESLIKRVSALLYRNPSELSQVVREARDQAEAEAKLWRERLQGGRSNAVSS